MEPLKPRPRTSEMTFWSRHDPIRQPKGNTDHWSKFRQRTTYQVSFGDKIYDIQYDALRSSGTTMRPKFYTDKTFDGLITDGMRTSLPDLNQRPRFCSPRGSMRSSYNERAKEGFRYWLIDRPKPTKFGRYGIGSYKTVLGIGNAPRT